LVYQPRPWGDHVGLHRCWLFIGRPPVTADDGVGAFRHGPADDEVLGRLAEVDPAVVRSVERALGCRVFENGPAGVSVTEVGARVLPYTRILLAVARAMVAEVALAGRPQEEQ
jgi:hypothetical protein